MSNPSRTPRSLAVAAGLLLVALTAACGSDDSGAAADPSSSTSAAASSSADPSAPASSSAPPSSAAESSTAAPGGSSAGAATPAPGGQGAPGAPGAPAGDPGATDPANPPPPVLGDVPQLVEVDPGKGQSYLDALHAGGLPPGPIDAINVQYAPVICQAVGDGRSDAEIVGQLQSVAQLYATTTSLNPDQVARLYVDSAKRVYC